MSQLVVEDFNFGAAAPNIFFMAKEAERQLESIHRVTITRQTKRPIITIVGFTENGCRPIVEFDFLTNEIVCSQTSGSGAVVPGSIYHPQSFAEWHELARAAISVNFGCFRV